MIPCAEAMRLKSESADRRLTLRERFDLWFHTFICGVCERGGLQLEIVDQVTKRFGMRLIGDAHDTGLSEEQKNTLRACMHQAAQQPPAPESRAASGGGHPH